MKKMILAAALSAAVLAVGCNNSNGDTTQKPAPVQPNNGSNGIKSNNGSNGMNNKKPAAPVQPQKKANGNNGYSYSSSGNEL